jgi:hypothetical protein
MRQSWAIAFVMLFVAAVIVANAPDVGASGKTILFPYEQRVEQTAAPYNDSIITLNDNVVTHALFKSRMGQYQHRYRFDHRDSAKTLTFDTCDFYFDITDYDAGVIGYGIAGYDHPEIHDDSGSIQWAVTVELGTELGGGGFQKLRGLGVQEHGIGTDEVDTIAYDKTIAQGDTIFFINIAEELPGQTDADSSWMLCADKVRLRLVYKDSTQGTTDTLFDDGWTFLYRAFMLVRQEY